MYPHRIDSEEALPWVLVGPAFLFALGSVLSFLAGNTVDGAGFGVLALLTGGIGLYLRSWMNE